MHCSAGVGRTGTFLAVYKLLLDTMDPGVTTLDPMGTVLTMRRHRMKMVQRKEQYKYVVHCLRNISRFEDDEDYYELRPV